jgi:hypothetical protein
MIDSGIFISPERVESQNALLTKKQAARECQISLRTFGQLDGAPNRALSKNWQDGAVPAAGHFIGRR